jgi:hypothetical protein
MHSMSTEHAFVLRYLDWMTLMPWGEATPERFNVQEARSILEEDHFALDEVKVGGARRECPPLPRLAAEASPKRRMCCFSQWVKRLVGCPCQWLLDTPAATVFGMRGAGAALVRVLCFSKSLQVTLRCALLVCQRYSVTTHRQLQRLRRAPHSIRLGCTEQAWAL